MFDMYRVKKKKPVDPNAPPRPNLLNHEKRLKDTTGTVEQMQSRTQQLEHRVEELERKLINQTQYLNALHQSITARSKNSG
jgi:predicted RNase H-like nuclease (RuvC/YqgF family)